MYVSAKLFSSCKGPPGNSAIHKVSQTRGIGALPKLGTKCEVQMKTIHVTKKQKKNQVLKLVFSPKMVIMGVSPLVLNLHLYLHLRCWLVYSSFNQALSD